MIATYAFVIAGVSSWFNPPAMYGTQAVCAWNIDHGKPVDIFIVNEDNRRTAKCRVIGTGPFYGGRVLDVSPSVARQLGFYDAGTAHVRVYRILPPEHVETNCTRRSCGVFVSCDRASHPQKCRCRICQPTPGART